MFNVDGDTGFITAESHIGGGSLKPSFWSQEETLAIGSQEQLGAGDPQPVPFTPEPCGRALERAPGMRP